LHANILFYYSGDELGLPTGAGGDVIRRRNIQYGEETVEVDRFHHNDMLGTIKEHGEPDGGA
jgi:hypothetical protein